MSGKWPYTVYLMERCGNVFPCFLFWDPFLFLVLRADVSVVVRSLLETCALLGSLCHGGRSVYTLVHIAVCNSMLHLFMRWLHFGGYYPEYIRKLLKLTAYPWILSCWLKIEQGCSEDRKRGYFICSSCLIYIQHLNKTSDQLGTSLVLFTC